MMQLRRIMYGAVVAWTVNCCCGAFYQQPLQRLGDRSSSIRSKPASWLLRPPSVLLEAINAPATVRNTLVDEEEEVVTLRSKLDILQGVVRELHHQTKETSSAMLVEKQQIADNITHLTNKHKDELQAAVKQVESRLTHRIQSLEEQLDDVTVQLEDKTSELLFLQEQWNVTEGKLLEANKHLKAKEQEIQAMNEKAAAREEWHASQLQRLRNKHQEQLAEQEATLMELVQTTKEEQQATILSLETQLEECQINMEERVEIATAAVQAAEQRSRQVSEQLQDSDRRHQRAQVLLKLYQLVLEGLLREAAEQSGQE